jgi:6-phosphofructokinase 1
MANLRRIGILTAGGDCPGLNAVIRAVVKSGVGKYGLEVVGIEDGYLGLIENRMHVMSLAEVSNILTAGGTVLGSSNKAEPSNFAIQQEGRWVRRDVTEEVLANCRNWNLEALVVIGGDGTMAGAAKLIERGLKIVGVPKTIDNDLVGTDITFGHDTAVATAAEALDKVHTTAASHHRVMVVELMGRYAGWLALRAGLASGADVILIPEIPFRLEAVADICQRRSRIGKRETIIAVGEGAMPEGGKVFIDHVDNNSPDPIRLGGIGKYVAQETERLTGIESRSIVLGHVQRGGTPTAHDRILATTLACHAMELLVAGQFGQMVAVQQGMLKSVPIDQVAGKIHKVSPDDGLVCAARDIGISFGN